ncbi:MAG: NAD(P)/FAD-dependent oxidoreductase [Parvibaculaceae bacterium]
MGGVFDIAVIGGGVVGCAALRRFALDGLKAVLIEAEPDILCGASKGNSAILHTGFDAPASSLELQCVRDGHAEYLAIRRELNLPFLETGALVVAWSEEEAARLSDILAQAHANEVEDVHPVSRRELRTLESNLSEGAVAALRVPRESIIDPWSAPLAYVTQALANGAEARFSSLVSGGEFDGEAWSLALPQGTLKARWVVNCAGLFGDRLDKALLGEAAFTIQPRKGQFVVYDKPAAGLVSSIILPVPSERTKGIVLCRTAFGNLIVGPTAEEQESRTDTSVTTEALEMLKARAATMVPALAGMPVTATYAGLRPGTERKDYRVSLHRDRHWITCGGIRSTGLTAALGIARHLMSLYASAEPTPALRPRSQNALVPNLSEESLRDWQQPGCGRIVCHCELVTEREIAATFASPLPPRDIGGLKRRTRAMMGRCQGFYCSAEVDALARGRLDPPLSSRDAHG